MPDVPVIPDDAGYRVARTVTLREQSGPGLCRAHRTTCQGRHANVAYEPVRPSPTDSHDCRPKRVYGNYCFRARSGMCARWLHPAQRDRPPIPPPPHRPPPGLLTHSSRPPQGAFVKSGVPRVDHATALLSPMTSMPSANLTPSITLPSCRNPRGRRQDCSALMPGARRGDRTPSLSPCRPPGASDPSTLRAGTATEPPKPPSRYAARTAVPARTGMVPVLQLDSGPSAPPRPMR